MRNLVLLAAFGIVATAQGQTEHMTITFSGNPAGESTWTESPDGSFSGLTSLRLGTLTLTSKTAGRLDKTKLVELHSKTDVPGSSAAIDIEKGMLTVQSGKQKTTNPFNQTSFVFAGNALPGAWRTTALDLHKRLLAHPNENMIAVNPLFLDLGQNLSVNGKLLPDRILKTKTGTETIQRVLCTVGLAQLELDFKPEGTIVAMDIPGQKLRFVMDGYDGLFEDPLAKYPELSQPTFQTKTELGVKVKMPDGAVLATDIERPVADGKYPVILERTPYGRAMSDIDGDFYAKRGYVFICQDCRGRGDSTGEWDPFVHEGKDGYDTISWIEQQPWSNGRVGMIGASYLGYVQWAVAVLHPDALKCIVPQVSPPDAMHNLPYEFGCPFIYGDIWWAKIVAGKDADFSSMLAALPHPEKLTTLPLDKVDQAVLGQSVPFYQKWIRRTTSNDWKGWDFNAKMSQANVPALQISGWWDGDGIGTKLNWAEERSLGRKNQWLIEGPWSHLFNTSTSIGKMDFGPDSIIDLDSVYLRWFDTWLKEKQVGLDQVPHVKVFVTGANKWRELSDWPDPSEQTRTYYLSKGSLEPKSPSSGSESYRYDPSKDVTTAAVAHGNENVNDTTGNIKGLDKKAGGYLLFKSAPLEHDINFAGPASVDLTFKTTAYDTDFFVTFLDISPDGVMGVVGQSGKLRCSYRNGVDHIDYLKPGKTYTISVLPWDFAKQFKKGHRLGVVVTSSMFPLFARNLGTKEPIATGTHMIVQRNTIKFGGPSPSKVVLHALP